MDSLRPRAAKVTRCDRIGWMVCISVSTCFGHIDRSRWEAHSPPSPALSLWHPRPVNGYVVALRYSSLTARPLGSDHTRRAGGLAIPGSLLLGLLPAVARFAGGVRLSLARLTGRLRFHRTSLPITCCSRDSPCRLFGCHCPCLAHPCK